MCTSVVYSILHKAESQLLQQAVSRQLPLPSSQTLPSFQRFALMQSLTAWLPLVSDTCLKSTNLVLQPADIHVDLG